MLINDIEHRDAFGIINPETGKIYSDIRWYCLTLDIFSPGVYNNEQSRMYVFDDVEYHLHMDLKLQRTLRKREVEVIISIQKRTNINIAMARVYVRKEEDKIK